MYIVWKWVTPITPPTSFLVYLGALPLDILIALWHELNIPNSLYRQVSNTCWTSNSKSDKLLPGHYAASDMEFCIILPRAKIDNLPASTNFMGFWFNKWGSFGMICRIKVVNFIGLHNYILYTLAQSVKRRKILLIIKANYIQKWHILSDKVRKVNISQIWFRGRSDCFFSLRTSLDK